jgi:hypothetical protein
LNCAQHCQALPGGRTACCLFGNPAEKADIFIIQRVIKRRILLSQRPDGFFAKPAIFARRRPKHDPEKCAAIFPRDKREGVRAENHAQSSSQSAMTIQPNLMATKKEAALRSPLFAFDQASRPLPSTGKPVLADTSGVGNSDLVGHPSHPSLASHSRPCSLPRGRRDFRPRECKRQGRAHNTDRDGRRPCAAPKRALPARKQREQHHLKARFLTFVSPLVRQGFESRVRVCQERTFNSKSEFSFRPWFPK